MKRAFLPLLAVVFLVCGCKPVEVVKNHYYTHTYVDSVYVDCTDSVCIVQRGDTVRITEIRERVEYRTRIFSDTAVVRDTVIVERKVGKVGNTGKVGVFFSGFGFSALLFFLLVTIFFIFLRKKKP